MNLRATLRRGLAALLICVASGFVVSAREPVRFPETRAPYYVPPQEFPPHDGVLKPRAVTPRDFYLNLVDVSNQHVLIVKFTEESQVRWDGHWPYSKAGQDLVDVYAFLARHPEIEMYRESRSIPEATLDEWERTGEANMGEDLANLNNFYVLQLNPNPAPLTLLKEVIELKAVETAFYLPKVTPACTDLSPMTPGWQGSQGYLNAAPTGIDADFARGYHGFGAGNPFAMCIDIEQDWTEDHEDFPTSFGVIGDDGGNPAAHGDAVIGEMMACSTSYGVTGICYNVVPQGVAWPQAAGDDDEHRWENAFNTANNNLVAGESYLIEIHSQGPSPGGNCDSSCGNCGQWRYVAVEFWDNVFSAIQTHTANGVIVYEAAGNGQMDLDNAIYGNRFNRGFRNSHAIIVGANGGNGSMTAPCWSNYGSRVDLSGWGNSVTTCGYGDLWMGGTNRNQWYTSVFNGTSSATPIVTGAGNDLQGIAQGKYHLTLTADQIRTFLSETGTAWTGSHEIGEQPDLAQAVHRVEPDLYPAAPYNWTAAIVPRNNNGGIYADCHVTPVLDGNVIGTYVNFALFNGGIGPAPEYPGFGFNADILLDGELTYIGSWDPRLNYLQFAYWNDFGPFMVRGGRHDLKMDIDPGNSFAERSRTNNQTWLQYVWSPQVLLPDFGIDEAAPPIKDYGAHPNFNGVGYQYTGGWWTVCAAMPSPGNDIDLYGYPNSFTSQSGFSTIQESSERGVGLPELVATNGNVLGYGQTRLFQAVRYLDASTSNYEIQGATQTTISGSSYNSVESMADHNIVDFFEFHPGAGNDFFVGVRGVSAWLDLAIVLFPPGSDYYKLVDGEIHNAAGIGGNESATWNNSPGGWWGCAVIKANADMYGVAGSYYFDYVSPPTTNLTSGAGRPGWNPPIVPRNDLDATNESAPLPFEVASSLPTYINATWLNAGVTITNPFDIAIKLDGQPLLTLTEAGPLAGYTYGQAINVDPAQLIRGGNHTLLMQVDPTNQVAEGNEGDNEYWTQLCWRPTELTTEVPQTRAAPPELGINMYPNNDGFSFIPGGICNVVAIASPSATADYDLEYYDDYCCSTSGYHHRISQSVYGIGVPDLIFMGSEIAAALTTFYPSVITFNDAQDPYVIEAEALRMPDRDLPDEIWVLNDELTSGELVNLYRFLLFGGQTYTIACHVVSGNADIGLRLFLEGNTLVPRQFATRSANANGPGGDEQITVTPDANLYYALVVEKLNFSAVANSATYRVGTGDVQGPQTPQAVDDLVIRHGAGGSRLLSWSPVSLSTEGQPLVNPRYEVYRGTDLNTLQSPANFVTETTATTYTDLSSLPGVRYYYLVTVMAD